MPRRLSAEEAALWRRVMAEVRPMPRRASTAPPPELSVNPPATTPGAPKVRLQGAVPKAISAAPQPERKPASPGETLDGGWDRRLARGLVSPDSSLDLHGHSLSSAYALLDQGLGAAIARGDRVLLLVTGKPPRPESERPHARGAIRAAVGDWLGGSRHADRIAAVRQAHPRHGGTGALYIILRRTRQVS